MAPKITQARQIQDRKPGQEISTPKEFDFSKINIGNFLLNRGDDNYIQQWLNYKREYNQPIYEKLKKGKENLAFIRETMATLKTKINKSKDVEEINIFEAQYKALRGDEWLQICTNVHTAHSLA